MQTQISFWMTIFVAVFLKRCAPAQSAKISLNTASELKASEKKQLSNQAVSWEHQVPLTFQGHFTTNPITPKAENI